QILRLRQERARLLGHAHHAAWTLADNMAGTPAKAAALLERLWRAAKAKALEEIADLQAVADQQSPGGEPAAPIAPWDYRFYAEQLSVQRYQFDEAALKPYLQLDRLVAGMFWMAGENYGLRFTPLPEAAKAHPDVQVYAVTRGAPDDEGEPVGVFYLDLYARPGKRSGAWMNNYRDQHGLDGPGRAQLPIVSNNANFSPPARAGEPVLISWGDATTLFHEFGHGLHGLLSNVTYPSLAGTAVKADFVEFPSQLTEHWLHTPELLGRYARHVQTGEPLPAALLQAIQASRHFMQGMASVEYLLSALYDLRLHSLADASAVDPMAFEAALLRELDAPMALTLRHRPPHFGHIFSGDYYAAGYYVYLWADALVADAAEAFEAAPGGFYDRTLVQRLLQDILAAGNSLPPDEAFRRFRGRDVEPDALLRSRGFAVVD
ncbi:MAG: Peptidyl-dipeptidase dcp, partial [Pseudomonadota bacterium]